MYGCTWIIAILLMDVRIPAARIVTIRGMMALSGLFPYTFASFRTTAGYYACIGLGWGKMGSRKQFREYGRSGASEVCSVQGAFSRMIRSE